MEIRKAQWHELEQVVSLGRSFFDTTTLASDCTFNPEYLRQILAGLLMSPKANLLVIVDGATVVGMIGLSIERLFMADESCATELFWYVQPEYRGQPSSVHLLSAAEKWAQEAGAHFVGMGALSTSPPQVRALYLRRGYQESQTYFSKRINP